MQISSFALLWDCYGKLEFAGAQAIRNRGCVPNFSLGWIFPIGMGTKRAKWRCHGPEFQIPGELPHVWDGKHAFLAIKLFSTWFPALTVWIFMTPLCVPGNLWVCLCVRMCVSKHCSLIIYLFVLLVINVLVITLDSNSINNYSCRRSLILGRNPNLGCIARAVWWVMNSQNNEANLLVKSL